MRSNSLNFTELSFEENLCVNFVLNDELAQIVSFESTFYTYIMLSQNFWLLANHN